MNITTSQIIPQVTPPPVTPQAKASYAGGEALPTVGTPEYAQAQQMSSQVQPIKQVTPTVKTNITYPSTSPYQEQTKTVNSKLNNLQSDYQDVTDSFQRTSDKVSKTLEGIRTGTIPLTPYEQAQIDSSKKLFEETRNAQLLANKNYEGGVTVSQETRGLSRYSPEIAAGNIFAAVTEGNKRVAELDARSTLALAQMEQGFRDSDFNKVKSEYDVLTKAKESKTAAIEKMQETIQKENDNLVKAQQEQVLSQINTTLTNPDLSIAERQSIVSQLIASGNLSADQMKEVQSTVRQSVQDDITNKLNSDRFSWQQKQDMIDNAIKQGQLDQGWAKLALDKSKQDTESPSGTVAKDMAKSQMTSTIGLIDTILNSKYLSNITGLKTPGGLKIPFVDKTVGELYGSPTVEVSNQARQLVKSLAIENRQKLKGSGAISDYEAKTLEQAATSFSTGLSDEAAVRELKKVRGVMRTASGLTTTVKIKDPTTGKFQIGDADRATIERAVEDGMLIEYQ